MERVTARLEDEQHEWVEEIAEEFGDRSEAWVIRQAVDLARGEESVFEQRGAADRGAADRIDELEEAVAEVSQRLADVEEQLEDERDEATGDLGLEELLTGWSHGRGREERSASRRVAVEATEWLRDRGGPVRRADVLDELGERLEEVDPMDRDAAETLWPKVVRSAWDHLAEKGVIEKPHSRAYEWVGS